jgi:hypothetical protein
MAEKFEIIFQGTGGEQLKVTINSISKELNNLNKNSLKKSINIRR